MRPIHLARMDKVRPVLVLTREVVRPHLRNVTVAAITSTVRGISSELRIGTANGLHQTSVVSLDNVHTIPVELLGSMKTPKGEKAGFETSFTIDRKDYGIEWNRVLDTGGAVLGNDIKITVAIEADRQQAEAPKAG